jgi:hypothetical protein
MKHIRTALPLALTLLLAACAPSTTPTQTTPTQTTPTQTTPTQTTPTQTTPTQTTPTQAVEAEAPEITVPVVATSGANAAFNLIANRNGKVTSTRFDDGFHYVETPAYLLGISFTPNELLSVDSAEYDAYSENAEVLASAGLLLRLFNSGPTGFEFSIANKSQNPIQIVWDETAVVLTDGSSSRVIHEGVRFSDMNNAQPPAIIPPGARLDEYAGPTNLIELKDEWQTDSLFREFDEGATVSFFLALNVNGERQNLNFAFAANRSHELLRGGDIFSK